MSGTIRQRAQRQSPGDLRLRTVSITWTNFAGSQKILIEQFKVRNLGESMLCIQPAVEKFHGKSLVYT